MGALGWKIDRANSIVVVRGVGLFNLSFITSFRSAMRAENGTGYGKLFDLHRADIQLSDGDLQAMVASTRLCSAETAGPIAIVLGKEPPPSLVDMAVLLRNRIGVRRRMRLFIEEAEARQWLASERAIGELSAELAHLPTDMLRLNRRH